MVSDSYGRSTIDGSQLIVETLIPNGARGCPGKGVKSDGATGWMRERAQDENLDTETTYNDRSQHVSNQVKKEMPKEVRKRSQARTS